MKKIGEVILDVRNISLAFGGVKALTDISFDVREHEVRAIIGPNGAGKSSMLNCINGVYQPQQGSISFRGQTFKHMALRYADYGYILENGRIVMDGEAASLRENEDVKEFYLGTGGDRSGERRSFRDVKSYKRRKRWLA